ncbi:hypothetical protein VTI28DRAFT_4485 [Corynascus sepedonium]
MYQAWRTAYEQSRDKRGHLSRNQLLFSHLRASAIGRGSGVVSSSPCTVCTPTWVHVGRYIHYNKRPTEPAILDGFTARHGTHGRASRFTGTRLYGRMPRHGIFRGTQKTYPANIALN